MNYILAPDKIKTGDEIISGRNKEIKIGNCMPLCDIPAGTDIHNIELSPNGGGKLARSAGSSATISGTDENYCLIKLASGEVRKVINTARATIGSVSNGRPTLREILPLMFALKCLTVQGFWHSWRLLWQKKTLISIG